MHAIYAAVLRSELGPVFLAEYGDASHLKAELRSVLGRIDTSRSGELKEKVLRYDCYMVVHAKAPSTLIFVVLVDGSGLARDRAVGALVQLQNAVRARDDLNLMNEGDRPLQAQLEPMLARMVAELNDEAGSNEASGSSGEPPSSGRLDKLRTQVSDVKQQQRSFLQVMADNIERVMARGERLEDLVDRTEDLEAASADFRTSAYRVRRVTCWRNAKWNIIMVTAVATILLVIAFVILYETGVFSSK